MIDSIGTVSRSLVVEFTKMSGAGNDFIVIDNRFYHFSRQELAAIALKYCPRRSGVGADGILALERAKTEDVDFTMTYINADGTIGSMCGNGARCLVRFASKAGIEGSSVRFQTDAGIYRAEIPAESSEDILLYVPPCEEYRPDCQPNVETGSGPVTYVWTGTEHIVAFVDAVEEHPVDVDGPLLRSDASICPSGANVNFVSIVTNAVNVICVRTWEKGVEAETMACGTGAIATAVAAVRSGRVEGPDVVVQMRGGNLHVGGAGSDYMTLSGPVDTVFRGTIEV